MARTSKRRLVLVAALVAVLATTGCSDGGSPAAQTAADAEVSGDYDSVSDEDREVLDALVEQGADLSERRKVRHYLYFDSQARASSAADEAEAEGWQVAVVEPNADVPEWSVEAVQDVVLTAKHVSESTELFERQAMQGDGEYDGWEAAAS